MADQDLIHTAEVMKAALPYIDTPNKVMLEFAMKLIELMGLFKTFRSSLTLASCGYQAGQIDMEGMLNNIRPVCNKQERDMIDKILNMFNMKRAFEMYSKMMDAMNIMQGMEGFSFGSEADSTTDTPAADYSSYNSDTDFSSYAADADYPPYAADAGYPSYSAETDYSSSNHSADFTDNRTAHTDEKLPDAAGYADKAENASSGSASMFNDKMLEMLMAMVPPEQKATFDNLSMLLNTMSYDNNSKADEGKEQESNG